MYLKPSSIYQALKLNNLSRGKSTTGEIVNLISVDAQKLQDIPGYLHFLWFAMSDFFLLLGLSKMWVTLYELNAQQNSSTVLIQNFTFT